MTAGFLRFTNLNGKVYIERKSYQNIEWRLENEKKNPNKLYCDGSIVYTFCCTDNRAPKHRC
ncbi:hypothetical protein KL86CLO1_12468 [uncultured Eubacteriales bacterium]|uniref:Uncharacterized protein n=1 Tax=uncultured Eubacteriales bacterium TaxID=172733 RepID=A0A212K9T7_9FIRM|nr:hypothetical protein KL86CLO1_12468 [uncultured Eubacteriales bacterium]